MNLSISNVRRTFIPKGNGVVRKYHKNNHAKNFLNGFSLSTAACGFIALVSKEPEAATALAGVSLGSAALSNYFNKNAKALKNQFNKILTRATSIEIAQIRSFKNKV